MLSVLVGVLGLAIARWGLGLLVNLLGDRLPNSAQVHLDGTVLAFTAALSIITGILFGLAPAFQAGKQNLVRPGSNSAAGSAAASPTLRSFGIL